MESNKKDKKTLNPAQTDLDGSLKEETEPKPLDDEIIAESQIDDSTDKAVDDIAKSESDMIIANEDKKLSEDFIKSPSRWERIKSAIKDYWADPKKRNLTLGGVGILLVVLFAVPLTRYGILNTVGVRATANMTIVDAETKLPLKNVKVMIDGKEALTDIGGVARLEKVKLGTREIKVTKLAYAELSKKVTIGLGGNDIEALPIDPTGARYSFNVADWLSGSTIENAEVTFGENNALSDSSGLAILTVPPTEEESITVQLAAEGYRETDFELTTQSTISNDVKLVVATQHFYISNREDRFDVYRADADGANEELLVKGTKLERDDLRFSVSPSNDKAVLVATREDVRNDEGYLLSGLYSMNTESGVLEKKDESERIDLVGWADGNIIYVKVAAGASGTNPQRHRLMALNLDTNESVQLAASNYFNDVLVAQNYVFYAPSSAYKENAEPFLFRVNADGNDNQTVYDKEVWSIVQNDYDSIFFDAKQVWYKSGISILYANKQEGPPSERTSNIYETNPEGGIAAWVDRRDGKGELLLHTIDTTEEKTIVRMSGLRHPVRWLSAKHLLFRTVNENETADYVVNIEGGDPKKITDVANVAGVDRWYYYY